MAAQLGGEVAAEDAQNGYEMTQAPLPRPNTHSLGPARYTIMEEGVPRSFCRSARKTTTIVKENGETNVYTFKPWGPGTGRYRKSMIFYDDLIVIKNESKTGCCYPWSFSKYAIPKYQIVSMKVSKWDPSMPLIGSLVLFVVGCLFMIAAEPWNYDSDGPCADDDGSCGLKNDSSAKVKAGIGGGLWAATLLSLCIPCCFKKYYLTLRVNEGADSSLSSLQGLLAKFMGRKAAGATKQTSVLFGYGLVLAGIVILIAGQEVGGRFGEEEYFIPGMNISVWCGVVLLIIGLLMSAKVFASAFRNIICLPLSLLGAVGLRGALAGIGIEADPEGATSGETKEDAFTVETTRTFTIATRPDTDFIENYIYGPLGNVTESIHALAHLKAAGMTGELRIDNDRNGVVPINALAHQAPAPAGCGDGHDALGDLLCEMRNETAPMCGCCGKSEQNIFSFHQDGVRIESATRCVPYPEGYSRAVIPKHRVVGCKIERVVVSRPCSTRKSLFYVWLDVTEGSRHWVSLRTEFEPDADFVFRYVYGSLSKWCSTYHCYKHLEHDKLITPMQPNVVMGALHAPLEHKVHVRPGVVAPGYAVPVDEEAAFPAAAATADGGQKQAKEQPPVPEVPVAGWTP